MEPTTDDDVDFALAILYHRRRVVDEMIRRLKQRENDLSIERFLAPALAGHERLARKAPWFERMKGWTT